MKEALLLKVGKALDNDIVLNIPFISEYHLEVFQDIEGNVFMTDLDSVNGTFVNGNRLKGFVLLNPKDEVFLGSGFKFQWEQILNKPKSNVNNSEKQSSSQSKEGKKYVDAYELQSPKKTEVKIKKPFLKEHLDLIVIYGLIFAFFLYCYLKVS